MRKSSHRLFLRWRMAIVFFGLLSVVGLGACPGDDTHDYAGDGDLMHTLLMAMPADGPGPFPAVVYIHGGKWGDPSVDASYFRKGIEHAAGNGFVGVSINYHLTSYDPHTTDARPWPDQLHDAKKAVAWLRGHASEFKIDPERIFVLGHSAGAHIALMMALTNSGMENPLYDFDESGDVQAVCSVAGPTHLLSLYLHTSVGDVEEMFDALIEPDPVVRTIGSSCSDTGCPYWLEGRCIGFSGYCEANWIQEDRSTAPYNLAEASPLQNLMELPRKPDGTAGHVPILMVFGTEDLLVPPAYQHRPFFNLLDPEARQEAFYPSNHSFTWDWFHLKEGGIHDTAYAFFASCMDSRAH
jgi:hypothetical protein